MTYSNPLSTKLGLLDDDLKTEGKLLRLCADLHAKILTPVEVPFQWHYVEENLAADVALKANWQAWKTFDERTVWARSQDNTWFAAEVTVPKEAAGKTFIMRVTSQWSDRPG